jgi:hypothetical protein
VLAELRKHAQTGAALQRRALEKQAAGALRAIGRGAKNLGLKALANPMQTATIGFGSAAGIGAGAKTYHSFNPAAQRKQLGMVP